MDSQDHSDDKDIIAGLRRFDRGSGDELVRKYHKRLLVFIERRHDVPRDFAQEITQKVFCKIVENPALIRVGTDRLDGLLYTACKNSAIDWHRTRKTEQEHLAQVVEELRSQGEIYDPWEELPKTFPPPHIVLLRQSLSGLDRKKREVLTMWAEGLRDSEVAKIVGDEEGTIRQRRKRALEEVGKRYLNQLENQPAHIKTAIRKKLRLE
jgi:RNA polymerase sigma factor (sigma-70 family)